jgi:hypothetical protein
VTPVFLDAFHTLETCPRNYKDLKRAVLRAGRFSIFEATATPRSCRMYTRLNHDPDLIVDPEKMTFPWIAVAKKERDA